MMATSLVDVRQRLGDPALPSRVANLGFRDRDVPDLLKTVATVLARERDLELIALLAERLVTRIGDFGPTDAESVWSGLPDQSAALGTGVLPMLALLVTAPEVAAFHTGRGVPPDVSSATLADLGQQVSVHRLTHGEFGLHTQEWLTLAWSGALYRLGRLQFNLQLDEGHDQAAGSGWVLSTHIPATGPLTPESVDASFAAAGAFFATHFPDYPTHEFYCSSWLLDPALSALLPQSNLASFQRRWHLSGEPQPGDVDTLFFVFHRRAPVDASSLPTDTTLRRLTAAKLAAGQSWSVLSGRLPQ